MSNIVIDIAAQFTGKKAFSASEKAIDNLAKTIKRAAIGGGITALLTNSAKAFAEDEKAAAMLANTLKNLGLQTFTSSIEAMIDKTQLATGVLDEQLRPAFTKLVTSTGDAIKAQELLKLSLDVSAGSSQDLVTVASDIANVMAGNNKGLKKYALGLSALELKTMSAVEVQAKFLEVYGGASEAASKTFAVSLNRIKASAEMARESLGKGLIDGLMIATGSQNIDELQQRILDFGKSAGNAFKTLGTLVRDNLGLLKSLAVTFAAVWTAGKVIAGITTVQKFIKALTASYKILRATAVGAAIAEMAVLNPIGAIAYGATLVAAITAATIGINKLEDAFGGASDAADKLAQPRQYGGIYADLYLKQKAAAEQKAIQDKIKKEKAAAAAIAAAKAKADKLAAANKAKLEKAAAVFDLQKIQIAAALKGKISEEEKTRLLLMQAIADEDATKAEKLQKKLEEIQKKNEEIAKSLTEISQVTNPFEAWADSLKAAAILLGGMPALIDAAGNLTPRGKKNLPSGDGLPDPGNGGNGGGNTFPKDATNEQIVAIVEAAVESAQDAADSAAASVEATQQNTEALAASADAALTLATETSVAADIAGQAQTSSMFNPYNPSTVNAVAEQASALLAAGSNAGAGTSSSMFNPYASGNIAGFGIPYSSTNVYVNVEGSMLSTEEYVKAVTQAIAEGTQNGYNIYRPGAVTAGG